MGDGVEIYSRTHHGSRITHYGTMEVRLQKVIADAGVASRRKAEELIAAGRVIVNGQVVRELGTRVDPEHDHVKVDGRHLKPAPPQAFIMLNKPKGVLSTLSDPEGRPTIRELLHGVSLRVFPVGRLDYDTEGLMLLTNDGEIAQALLHPRYHVSKTYMAKVKGVLSDDQIRELERGIDLEDGRTAPAIVKKAGKAEANSWIELTIYEGRKHQVKRMLEKVGHPVLKLERIRFGPLSLGDLPMGRFRFLTDREANALRAVVRARLASASGRSFQEDTPQPHLLTESLIGKEQWAARQGKVQRGPLQKPTQRKRSFSYRKKVRTGGEKASGKRERLSRGRRRPGRHASPHTSHPSRSGRRRRA
jgi:23S rRNA pseudouridine2605 synthase